MKRRKEEKAKNWGFSSAAVGSDLGFRSAAVGSDQGISSASRGVDQGIGSTSGGNDHFEDAHDDDSLSSVLSSVCVLQRYLLPKLESSYCWCDNQEMCHVNISSYFTPHARAIWTVCI